jgi:RNA polymerase-binding transcription factor DksA
MPAKKSPKSATKKTAAKKSARSAKKAPASKKTARSTAKKASRKAASSASVKTATATAKDGSVTASKTTRKKDATETIRKVQQNHNHVKQHTVKGNYVLFTIEEAREILAKRAKEESVQPKKAAKKRKPAAPAKQEAPVVDTAQQAKSRHAAASLDDILGLSAAAPSAASNKVPRKFQKYYALLIELRDEVRAELNLHSNDTLKRSSKDDSGDIAISVDAGTDNFDRDFALSLLSTEQDALKEIEAAIQRIYNGSYGICEETGEPISEERLEAVPFTRFSVQGRF